MGSHGDYRTSCSVVGAPVGAWDDELSSRLQDLYSAVGPPVGA
jgi:hypothetical protein